MHPGGDGRHAHCRGRGSCCQRAGVSTRVAHHRAWDGAVWHFWPLHHVGIVEAANVELAHVQIIIGMQVIDPYEADVLHLGDLGTYS